MKNIKILVSSLVVVITLSGISISHANQTIPTRTMQAARTAETKTVTPTAKTQTPVKTYLTVNALDVVKNPNFYLNKNIKIKAKFDKFSTLGLDYAPAMKSSEKFISFLIQRPDILEHNVPLSEMKIFLSRDEAEKHIDLNSGDIVEFTGKVFSTALGDPWVNVDSFTVISTTKKDEIKK